MKKTLASLVLTTTLSGIVFLPTAGIAAKGSTLDSSCSSNISQDAGCSGMSPLADWKERKFKGKDSSLKKAKQKANQAFSKAVKKEKLECKEREEYSHWAMATDQWTHFILVECRKIR